ncbi:HAD family hydrolase [Patescibacteria group bacterium]
MIKAILFDFDGTLADSLPLYIKAYDRTLKHFKFQFPDKKIVNTCFSKSEELICKNLNIKDVHTFKEIYFSAVSEFYKNIKLFPGVLKDLKFYQRKKIKLAICTFAYRFYIDKMLNKLDLTKYFELILSSDDVLKTKPNPEMAQKACQALKIKCSSSLMVGDSKGDILMGNAAGCKTILFFPKNYQNIYDYEKLKTTNSDFIIEDIGQIKKIATS